MYLLEEGLNHDVWDIYLKVCPECKGTNFKHDIIHDETYCFQCGLVLIAPSQPGVVFPGFKYITKKKLL